MVVLVISWAVLVGAVSMATWGLAPYDTTPLTLRPPQGSWQREVSDFFQSPPGSIIPPVAVTAASIMLLGIALRRIAGTPAAPKLALSFALTNTLAAIGMSFSTFIVADLPLELAPYPGYGWTVKFLIPDALMLMLLFVVQGRMIPKWLSKQAQGERSYGSATG